MMSAVSAYDCVGMHATVKISMGLVWVVGFQNKTSFGKQNKFWVTKQVTSGSS